MGDAEAQTLQNLIDSILFAPDFPKRPFLTNQQFKVLSQREKDELNIPRREAIARAVAETPQLEAMVRRLGRLRYEPAIPVLSRLWRECALEPVRVEAGRALYEMRTDEARDALAQLIDDCDDYSSFLAIRAIFDQDPFQAFDKLEARFDDGHPGSKSVGRQILSILHPSGYSKEQGIFVPVWFEQRAPSWLKQDPRWLDLCARLRRHAKFGEMAREVLRHADLGDVQAALTRTRCDKQDKPIETHAKARGDLLSRYQKGQFDAVWRDMRSYQKIDGSLREEVLAVAIDTMGRVAHNVDLVSERLQARGWKALASKYGGLRTRPATGDEGIIAEIEQITEWPVPPSLLAFWRIVGSINWIWDYETGQPSPSLGVDLDLAEMDPLFVAPSSAAVQEFDDWRDRKNEIDPDLIEPFQLDLAPDYLHKTAVSGGPPYAVYLPFHGADPVIANERHELPFIDYLRMAFRWAGFPRLADYRERQDVARFVGEFGKGLLPF